MKTPTETRSANPPDASDGRRAPRGPGALRGARTLLRMAPRLARRHAVGAVLLTVGALLFAVAFDLFLVPANVAPGGLGGLTLVLTHLLPLPKGATLFVLNIPLLLLGAWQLGGMRFLGRTAYVVVVTVVAIDQLAPLLAGLRTPADPLLDALYGGAVTGIASGIVIRAQANIGGTSILGRVLQRRTGIPMGQVYMLTDGVIVALMGIAFGWDLALYSLVALFINGLATDYTIEGPSHVRTVFIVTERPDAVATAVQHTLRTGVTAWQGQGMYRRGERTVLFCTINRTEVRELTGVVRRADQAGFVVVGQGHKALGGTIGRSDRPG